MGKKKTTSTQTQNTSQSSSGSSQGAFNSQNTFGQITPADTDDINAYRNFRPQIDPGLSYQYGNAKNNLRKSLISPTSGYRTAAMDDAILRNGERGLAQDEALRAEKPPSQPAIVRLGAFHPNRLADWMAVVIEG